jgi:hypothetical protein
MSTMYLIKDAKGKSFFVRRDGNRWFIQGDGGYEFNILFLLRRDEDYPLIDGDDKHFLDHLSKYIEDRLQPGYLIYSCGPALFGDLVRALWKLRSGDQETVKRARVKLKIDLGYTPPIKKVTEVKDHVDERRAPLKQPPEILQFFKPNMRPFRPEEAIREFKLSGRKLDEFFARILVESARRDDKGVFGTARVYLSKNGYHIPDKTVQRKGGWPLEHYEVHLIKKGKNIIYFFEH